MSTASISLAIMAVWFILGCIFPNNKIIKFVDNLFAMVGCGFILFIIVALVLVALGVAQ